MRAFPTDAVKFLKEPAWRPCTAQFLVRPREQCELPEPKSSEIWSPQEKTVWHCIEKALWPFEMSWAITVCLNGEPCFPCHRITLDGSHFLAWIDIRKAFPLWGPIVEMTASQQNIPVISGYGRRRGVDPFMLAFSHPAYSFRSILDERVVLSAVRWMVHFPFPVSYVGVNRKLTKNYEPSKRFIVL